MLATLFVSLLAPDLPAWPVPADALAVVVVKDAAAVPGWLAPVFPPADMAKLPPGVPAYRVYATAAEMTDPAGGRLLTAGDNVGPRLSPAALGVTGPLVRSADAAAFVNLARLRELHGDTLTAAGAVATFALRSGAGGFAQGFDPRQRASAAKLVNGLTRMLTDGEVLAAGVRRVPAELSNPGGLTAELGWACRPGTPAAELLAGEVPTGQESGLFFPSAGRVQSEHAFGPAVAAVVRDFAPEFVAPAADKAAVAAVAAYDKQLAAVTRVMTTGPVTWVWTPDAAGLAAAHRAAVRALPAGAYVNNLPLKQPPAVRPEAVWEWTEGDFVRVALDLDLAAATAGIADPNLRQATHESVTRLAAEQTVYWFGYRRGVFFRVVAPTKAEADAAVRAVFSRLSRYGDVFGHPFTGVRLMLPALSTATVTTETAPALTAAGDFLQAVGGALPAFPGFELPTIAVPKDAPASAVGLSLALTPRGGTVTVAVPAAAARLIEQSVRLGGR